MLKLTQHSCPYFAGDGSPLGPVAKLAPNKMLGVVARAELEREKRFKELPPTPDFQHNPLPLTS